MAAWHATGGPRRHRRPPPPGRPCGRGRPAGRPCLGRQPRSRHDDPLRWSDRPVPAQCGCGDDGGKRGGHCRRPRCSQELPARGLVLLHGGNPWGNKHRSNESYGPWEAKFQRMALLMGMACRRRERRSLPRSARSLDRAGWPPEKIVDGRMEEIGDFARRAGPATNPPCRATHMVPRQGTSGGKQPRQDDGQVASRADPCSEWQS
jgi:hypothetical protein